jgi:uracil-DNA glycosylase family 4
MESPVETAFAEPKARSYEEFRRWLAASGCALCPELCASRTHIVVDRGNPEAKVVLIGEAPGEKEDLQGQSFVGRSGQLLDKIMASIGVDTNRDTLILNVIKCRPPKNRRPAPEEARNCWPYLKKQLEMVKPRLVVLLGATAAKYFLTETKGAAMKDRVGRFFEAADFPGVEFQLLYHPAFLLRDPRKRADMDQHVQALRKKIVAENLQITGRLP